VQGHLWKPDGTLFVWGPCQHCDSQGVRYWDNGPVMGSPTYGPQSEFSRQMGVSKLYEWTLIDGIAVGQGEEGGADVQYRGRHYLLSPAAARSFSSTRPAPD
jgi:hypothetical protein